MPAHITNYLIFAAVILLIARLAVRRSARSRRIRIQRMWLSPILASIATVSTLAREPFPSIWALGIFALATAAGAGSGYFRALHTELTLDPETGNVSSRATPIGSALVVVFLFLRFAIEYFVKSGVPQAGFGHRVLEGPAAHGVDLFRLADAALIFSTMMTVARRYEVWRRAMPMIAAHKAARIEDTD